MISKAILSALFISLLAVSAFPDDKLSDKDKNEIKNAKEAYRVAWLKNEPEKVLALFTANATIYPNGLSARKGKNALREFWFAPSDTVTKITGYGQTVDEISGESKLAYVTGTTSLEWTMTNKKTGEVKRYESSGSYLSVFEKRNGKWLIHKHIWNGRFSEV